MIDLPLRGKKVVLRDWQKKDLPELRKQLEPGLPWQKLDGPYYPRPTAEENDRLLAKVLERIERSEWSTPRVQLALADSESDELIGRVSCYWQSKETWWLSAGVVVFDPDNWGRGIGSEALGMWCDYLFDAIPEIVRLDLRTWSGNVGMMRLAEKLGFQQEARFRQARIVDGEYYDGLGYGVLRSEWAQLRNP